MSIKKTSLNAIHRKLGARMVEFAGWDMPVQYEGALKEHLAVRSDAGVFDVSHMGEIEVTGPSALDLVQTVTCNDASRLSDGQAQYSALLYPDGTFVDDIVVYRFGPEHFFICVNAANRAKDFAWIGQHVQGDVQIADTSEDYAQLAVQGPKAPNILQTLVDVDLSTIRFYWAAFGKIAGFEGLISRTGYTGEDGFEIYVPSSSAEEIWTQLFRIGGQQGLKPVGLAARNTLRLEMKYSLYGNDIDNTTTPLEAGLGWIVKLDKGDFVGREALSEQKRRGVQRRLIGFEMIGRGIARDQYPVFLNGREIGKVNSGSFGPSVEKAIGLTYLPIEAATVGQNFHVGIRGKEVAARVVKTPFYQRA